MSWSEIKKAINSNLAKPLDTYIGELFTSLKNSNNNIYGVLTNSTYGNSAIRNILKNGSIVPTRFSPRKTLTKTVSATETFLSISGSGALQYCKIKLSKAAASTNLVKVTITVDGTVLCSLKEADVAITMDRTAYIGTQEVINGNGITGLTESLQPSTVEDYIYDKTWMCLPPGGLVFTKSLTITVTISGTGPNTATLDCAYNLMQ